MVHSPGPLHLLLLFILICPSGIYIFIIKNTCGEMEMRRGGSRSRGLETCPYMFEEQGKPYSSSCPPRRLPALALVVCAIAKYQTAQKTPHPTARVGDLLLVASEI